ncbi:sulfurtransferase [Methylomonas sp. SURF-2]|uniref:Sulfurtransferase n=1 Tax=Methylomonas subterranea TaxID=2952225 RepID=A0ABT1TKF6_9GAMM|nr:sulfurtransferase [Methylomonas sp. SURF-2]MCQ8105935.1 sulfurtransferase [Methylomonas sp. SURF-2]
MAYTTLISATELAANLHKPDWVIFDCRFSLADTTAGAAAYRRGHIPGARYADLNLHLSSPVKSYTGRHPLPDFSGLSKQLSAWGVGNRSQVVVYDDAGGAFAGRLWWLLRCMGHTDVAVLDGGMQYWQKQTLPVTTVLPKPVSNHFRCYPDQKQWLSATELENALAGNRIVLIDARAPERFQGRQEPIDPVAGHVPKAVNRPFQLNLDKQGLFLPATQLKNQFQTLLRSRPPAEVVHMCGSGVTACHNLLAMEIAGLSGSKLYAGSWSEWIVNKNRSVATEAA